VPPWTINAQAVRAILAAIPFNFIDFWRGFPPGSRPLCSFVSGEHDEHA
jgi:hypothetical protein